MSDAPYTLVLLRHGESTWNALNQFTGWVDVDLTEKGLAEAVRGGEMLAEAGVLPDVVHTSLDRASALANVELPMVYAGASSKERRTRAEAALRQVGLQDRMHHRPNELSGGQRQRVAIARALVKSPSLVIADEPTANLDSHTAQQIVDLLRELSHERGAAVVVATHDERMSTHCDRVLRLADGEIVNGELP